VSDVLPILDRAQQGDPKAAEELLPLRRLQECIPHK